MDLADVIAGRGPAPALVVALAMGLPDTSLTAAFASGGREHYGWGVDRHLAADTYDAVNLNTRASGNWRKKAPDLAGWPRPKTTATPERVGPVSVADIYQRLQRR